MMRALPWLVAVLFMFGCTEHAKDAVNTPNKNTGRIRGLVRFNGNAPALSFETPKEHEDICGHQVRLERLALGNGNGVQDAFVYLEGVQDGRTLPKPRSV